MENEINIAKEINNIANATTLNATDEVVSQNVLVSIFKTLFNWAITLITYVCGFGCLMAASVYFK